MAKIAVFRGKNIKELTNDANEFIKDKKILDMKHVVSFVPQSNNAGVFYDTIALLYEEQDPDREYAKPKKAKSVPSDTCLYCPNGPSEETCKAKNCIFGVK